ncbi:hypothetical protein E2C01_031784 [Portunus trituberculatus]|uniref:Uncharacterized protein n=1 Tax=Portunus trituberculatus TaxID=210409 RepID=A0A5B7EZ39_PORTR|nr:hypothetical protein [Portunus trituberculatus]
MLRRSVRCCIARYLYPPRAAAYVTGRLSDPSRLLSAGLLGAMSRRCVTPHSYRRRGLECIQQDQVETPCTPTPPRTPTPHAPLSLARWLSSPSISLAHHF